MNIINNEFVFCFLRPSKIFFPIFFKTVFSRIFCPWVFVIHLYIQCKYIQILQSYCTDVVIVDGIVNIKMIATKFKFQYFL